MKSKPDDSLVELVKCGEANAFPELVRRYQQFCTAKAISILRNRADAEDEVQNMWLKVWTHLATYRGPGVFRVWLGSIISNHCVRRLRRARVAPMTSLDEVLDSEESFQLEVIDQRARSDHAVENGEVLALLNKEINELPPLYREVLVRRYLRQREIGVIAADMGLSKPAVKSRLTRARLELKGRLDDHYGCAPLLQEPGGPLTAYSQMSESPTPYHSSESITPRIVPRAFPSSRLFTKMYAGRRCSSDD